MPGYLFTAPRIISLSPLSLATNVTDAELGANGLWLGTRTGAGATATLTESFFDRSPWPHGQISPAIFEKTKAAVFTRKIRWQLPELRLSNDVTEWVSGYRCLGIILDHRLNWKRHFEALEGKALRFLIAITSLVRSPLSLKAN